MSDDKKIKVCHFSSVHNQTDTRVFHRECEWLAKAYEVTLIAIGDYSGIKNGVKLIGIPKPKNRLQRILKTRKLVFNLALQEDADIYHFHDPELIPFALKLSALGKTVIYDIHENVTESLKDKNWLPLKRIFTSAYLYFEKKAASAFEFILAEESYVKVYQQRYPSKKLLLLRNFAPSLLLQPFINVNRNPANTELKLFYMGTLDKQYCFEQMLDAVYLLNKNNIPTRITCVGWMDEQLKSMLNQLPVIKSFPDKVKFIGFKEIEAGYALSTDAHFGLSFVSSSLNVAESFPRKMYEYMHIGLPVISSPHTLYKKMVEGNEIGVCASSNSGAAIADAIIALMGNPKKIETLVANNIQLAASTYNWEKEFDKLNTLYQTISTTAKPN
ncbi:MAG: glycosyltransferase family 4 protein [Bacteroidia bacterium]|nr:glycosyltransferase family 4 protein [Bacteroidia bacterium]